MLRGIEDVEDEDEGCISLVPEGCKRYAREEKYPKKCGVQCGVRGAPDRLLYPFAAPHQISPILRMRAGLGAFDSRWKVRRSVARGTQIGRWSTDRGRRARPPVAMRPPRGHA